MGSKLRSTVWAAFLGMTLLSSLPAPVFAQQDDACTAACARTCLTGLSACRRQCSYSNGANQTQSQIDACIQASCSGPQRSCQIKCRRTCPAE